MDLHLKVRGSHVIMWILKQEILQDGNYTRERGQQGILRLQQ